MDDSLLFIQTTSTKITQETVITLIIVSTIMVLCLLAVIAISIPDYPFGTVSEGKYCELRAFGPQRSSLNDVTTYVLALSNVALLLMSSLILAFLMRAFLILQPEPLSPILSPVAVLHVLRRYLP